MKIVHIILDIQYGVLFDKIWYLIVGVYIKLFYPSFECHIIDKYQRYCMAKKSWLVLLKFKLLWMKWNGSRRPGQRWDFFIGLKINNIALKIKFQRTYESCKIVIFLGVWPLGGGRGEEKYFFFKGCSLS